ncbi:hypothetical protein SAMN02910298_01968 [Pseudobutyrivibrio sp. YE44]|uniref:hypothetical protein n=1 Tax=Pseudobutyrivibrio sp. YE44 TaxID=1520802 RepID=UPI0008839472|nr:hypothetical protein [Pseudobutyrivibrio sp. YE44]SDB40215.1 hypothetical protein SAMN02910298_01968 [Pseudobutyrivibrio sp. YE44]
MELDSRIKDALTKIDFVKRYEELSNEYDSERTPLSERLIYLDGEEVMDSIAALGYKPLFDSKEKFFKIQEEEVEDYSFGFHIILRDGKADLVWVVRKDDELLLGAPWSTYSRRLISLDYRIKQPIYGDYDDLDEILKTAFEMYEDFKKAVLAE